MNIAEKLVRAIDRAINDPPKKTTPRLIFEWLVELDSRAALTAAETQGLQDAERAWKMAFDAASTYTEFDAKRRFTEQFGNGADHLDVTVRTRGLESLISENAAKQLAAKSAMCTASMNAATIASAVAKRIIPITEKALDDREAAETREAEAFGLTPVPSALASALKTFINILKSRNFVGNSGYAPRNFLPFFTLD